MCLNNLWKCVSFLCNEKCINLTFCFQLILFHGYTALSNCDIGLEGNIFGILWNGTVRIQNEFKILTLKNRSFSTVKFCLSFNEILQIFCHFSWEKVNEMTPRAILCLKSPIFSLNTTHNQIWTNFEHKCSDTLYELDEIVKKLARDYICSHTVVE